MEKNVYNDHRTFKEESFGFNNLNQEQCTRFLYEDYFFAIKVPSLFKSDLFKILSKYYDFTPRELGR
jgi:hypothetical protein